MFRFISDRFLANFKFITSGKIYHTEKLKTALERFESRNTILLYGRAGEGKSTTAFEMVKCLTENKEISLERCVMLSDPDDFKEIKSTEVDLILVDDIFGKHNTEANKLLGWENHFDTLKSFVFGQNIRLIACSRKHIYMECKETIEDIELFANAIELNSAELSNEEKRNILMLKLEASGRDFEDVNSQECIAQRESDVGFPLIASQFAMDDSAFGKKVEYFKRPFKYYLEQNMKKLDKLCKVTLFLIFCHENCLNIDFTIWSEDTINIAQYIANLQGVNEPIALLRTKLQEKMQYLEGTFLKTTDQSVSFLHETVYETVAMIYASAFPREVIKYCTVDFLCQCVSVEKGNSEREIVVKHIHYRELADRVVKEVIKMKNVQRLSGHSCLQSSKFVVELLRQAELSSQLHELFNAGHSCHLMGNHGLLFYVIENKHGNDVFFDHALEHLHCNHDENDIQGDCWKCAVKSEALASACSVSRMDIYEKLSNVGAKVTEFCFMKAITNPHFNQELAEKFFRDAKRQDMFPQYMTDSLISSLSSFCVLVAQNDTGGILKVLPQMLTCYQNTTMKSFLIELCLYFASQKQNAQVMSCVLEFLKKSNQLSWTDRRYVTRALTEVLAKSNNGLVEMLINAGAKWTEAAVYYAVREHDFETVVQTIQILKANNTFDPESFYMAWAMAIAMLHEDKRIQKKLKEEGVLPTTALVRDLVKTGQSEEVIQDVIEDLKRTDKWDPKDLRIGDAYITAHEEALVHIKDLLAKEGVGFCSSCLPPLVRRDKQNLPLFQQVVQELKKSGLLDPTDKYIAYALVLAKKLNIKSICDILTAEGVSFNMAALVYTVNEDLSDIEDLISELKSNDKWNPDSDVALEALNRAYKRHDKSIYDKLLSEGIAWKSRSLIVAVQFETVYSLGLTVNQMKERNFLESSHEDIQRAVEMAKSLKDRRKFNLLSKFIKNA